MRRLALGALLLVMACVEQEDSRVGAACLPEAIPEGGFNGGEVYLETSSVSCATRVCGVFRFDDDPSRSQEECVEEGGDATACAGLPTQSAIDERVFCTCRCATDTEGAATCECPAGFVCEPTYEREAGPGIAGSYCVRESIALPNP